jgi:hypothetical protein
MPKDPPRNQPNYKIGGYHLNEYEYEHNKGSITKEEVELPMPKHGAEELDFMPPKDTLSNNTIETKDSKDPDINVESPS